MKIKLALSEKGIEQAIKEYENWQKTLETRINRAFRLWKTTGQATGHNGTSGTKLSIYNIIIIYIIYLLIII